MYQWIYNTYVTGSTNWARSFSINEILFNNDMKVKFIKTQVLLEIIQTFYCYPTWVLEFSLSMSESPNHFLFLYLPSDSN